MFSPIRAPVKRSGSRAKAVGAPAGDRAGVSFITLARHNLLYSQKVMVVDIATTPAFSAGPPRLVLDYLGYGLACNSHKRLRYSPRRTAVPGMGVRIRRKTHKEIRSSGGSLARVWRRAMIEAWSGSGTG